MAEENVNELLSSVFSNTELMEKISGIVKDAGDSNKESMIPSVVSAITESIGSPKKSRESAEESEKTSKDVSVLSSHGVKDSAALLRAMKPFLSKERCDMVDNILKFEQLATLVRLTR